MEGVVLVRSWWRVCSRAVVGTGGVSTASDDIEMRIVCSGILIGHRGLSRKRAVFAEAASSWHCVSTL